MHFLKKPGMILACLMMAAIANAALPTSGIALGSAAQNVLSVAGNVIELIGSVFYISSAVMFISALLKFRIWRQNPQQMPFMTPLFELVLAAILGGIPYVTELTSHTFKVPAPSILGPKYHHGGVP